MTDRRWLRVRLVAVVCVAACSDQLSPQPGGSLHVEVDGAELVEGQTHDYELVLDDGDRYQLPEVARFRLRSEGCELVERDEFVHDSLGGGADIAVSTRDAGWAVDEAFPAEFSAQGGGPGDWLVDDGCPDER